MYAINHNKSFKTLLFKGTLNSLLFRDEGHRRRPHEPEVVAMGDEEASGEEV